MRVIEAVALLAMTVRAAKRSRNRCFPTEKARQIDRAGRVKRAASDDGRETDLINMNDQRITRTQTAIRARSESGGPGPFVRAPFSAPNRTDLVFQLNVESRTKSKVDLNRVQSRRSKVQGSKEFRVSSSQPGGLTI